MRILYFHQHFSTPKGPGGNRSYHNALKLVAEGHHVTMVCGSLLGGSTGLKEPFKKGSRIGYVDGIKVIQFNLPYSNKFGFIKRSYHFIKFAYKTIKVVFLEKYDIVFATSTPLTAGIPGIFAKWIKRRPFVFEVRDLWPELPKAMGVIKNPIILGIMSSLEWLTYNSADKIIGLSPGICKGIEKKGISIDKIAMVPNGCDIELFDFTNEKRRPVEAENDDIVFIYAGTHGIANGLDAIIEVVKVLNSRQTFGYKIMLFGDGMKKSELIQKAIKYGLSNLIFKDPVSKSEIAKIISGCDVGLQLLANVPAFYYGTSPNKFFDYLSAGVPVLTNYPGWIADLILENYCGFFVEPDNPEKFADLVEFIIQNKNQLKQMGINARKLAETKFKRDILTQQWMEEVLSVV